METIWEIIVKPLWYWLITVIPAIIGIIGAVQSTLPDNQQSSFMMKIYNLLPFWVWLLIAVISFVVTILVSTNNYANSLKEKYSKNKSDDTMTRAENGSQAVTVKDSPNTNINVNQTSKELQPPNIIIGLADENRLLANKITFYLKPLPQKLDIEKLIQQKRTKLLEEKKKYLSQNQNHKRAESEIDKIEGGIQRTISQMTTSSINSYEDRVDEYLTKYKNHLNDKYNYPFINDRYLELTPIIKSSSPASLVNLELSLPIIFPFPTWHIDHLRKMRQFTGFEYFAESEPKEPELIYIETYNTWALGPLGTSSHSRDEIITGQLNIEKQKDKYLIKYQIPDLIPHHPRNLPSIPIWLGFVDQLTTWNFPVKIYARELHQPIESNIAIDIIVLEIEK